MRALTFGHPDDGGLGDRLIAAVLAGDKTATSSTAVEYLDGTPLPRAGERLVLTDHRGGEHGIVETTRVRIIPLHEVGDDVAHAEGEGFADAAAWRVEHERFWAEVAHLIRAESGDPDWRLRDAEPIVVEWFRLVERAHPA